MSKGFEQLGNNGVARLGGIYALEGVMNTSEQYHKPVLEALCAFVRERTATETGDGPPATDIEAALTVIGRRVQLSPYPQPDLSHAHIPKANLSYAEHLNANLTGTDLAGADLKGAKLVGANLTGADLAGADLKGAILYDARLTGTKLVGANLSDAFLAGAILMNVNLTGADLTAAKLGGTDLTLLSRRHNWTGLAVKT